MVLTGRSTVSDEIESRAPGRFDRNTAEFPCVVCGGHAALPRGSGVRCAGFSLDEVVYCARPEYAGHLSLEDTEPASYKHRRHGDCGCGKQHGASWPRPVARTTRTVRSVDIMPVETRDAIYRAGLELMVLRDDGRADLRRRGLSDEAIERSLFRSIPRKGNELKGFLANYGRTLRRGCAPPLPRVHGQKW